MDAIGLLVVTVSPQDIAGPGQEDLWISIFVDFWISGCNRPGAGKRESAEFPGQCECGPRTGGFVILYLWICGFLDAIGLVLVSVSLLSPHQDIAAQDRVAGSGAVRRSAKCWAAVTIHRPPQEQLRSTELQRTKATQLQSGKGKARQRKLKM